MCAPRVLYACRQSRYFRDLWSAKHNPIAKNRTRLFFPIAIFYVFFCRVEPEFLTDRIGHAPDNAYGPHEACFSTIPSVYHHTNMGNSSSDGGGDGVEYTHQAGAPVAGEGTPGFRGTTTSSSAPPRWICDGVEVCPQDGNKRVAVGAADAQRGGGNA